MPTKSLIILFGMLLLCAVPGSAEVAAVATWTTPCTLGSGSNPLFSLDSQHRVTVAFEGEEHPLQSRLQEDGTWTNPERIATGLPENTIQAFDGDGNQWIARDQDEEITVSRIDANGTSLEKDVLVEKQKNVYVHLFHFSIDGQGISHLVFGRTPTYDCEANNPGAKVFYRRSAGSGWEKEQLVAEKMSFSRIWQKPGIAVDSQGRVFVFSYKDLYSFEGTGPVLKETCPLADVSMPLALAAQGTDTLHLIYHPYADNPSFEIDTLFYTTRKAGTWSSPGKIGHQPSEQQPALILTPAQELYAAWTDRDGNIRISRREADRSQAAKTQWLSKINQQRGGSVSQQTRATLLGRPTTVELKFLGGRDAPPHAAGAIGIVFTLAEADTLGGFHFGEFEGPDAPGGDMEIVVKSRNATATFHVHPQGSYVSRLPNGFSFDLYDPTAKKGGEVRKILQSLINDATSFELIITDPKDHSKKLRVEFSTSGLHEQLKALLQVLN